MYQASYKMAYIETRCVSGVMECDTPSSEVPITHHVLCKFIKYASYSVKKLTLVYKTSHDETILSTFADRDSCINVLFLLFISICINTIS